jgi:hypothetical protein
MYLKDIGDLKVALKNPRQAQGLVNGCVSKDIPNGWCAEAEE